MLIALTRFLKIRTRNPVTGPYVDPCLTLMKKPQKLIFLIKIVLHNILSPNFHQMFRVNIELVPSNIFGFGPSSDGKYENQFLKLMIFITVFGLMRKLTFNPYRQKKFYQCLDSPKYVFIRWANWIQWWGSIIFWSSMYFFTFLKFYYVWLTFGVFNQKKNLKISIFNCY